jgi:hypothetical protein
MEKITKNKRLTKRQRLSVYKRALTFIENNAKKNSDGVYHSGLCYAIGQSTSTFFYLESSEFFPEIYKHKPKKPWGIFWWARTKEGMDKRIKVLKLVIKELS